MKCAMIEVSTDTATICLFDKACLAHRVNDVGDWWSIWKNELKEINDGNAIFLNLEQDGTYTVNVLSEDFPSDKIFNLMVKSGEIFIGPGEEVTGGGLEPDGTWGGKFINLEPGSYECKFRRYKNRIDVYFASSAVCRNKVSNIIRI